jgi:5-methylcytosine-specific restriction endonuclease McrA
MQNKEKQKEWVRNNKDKVKKNNEAWVARDPEHARELARKRGNRAYARNPEKFKKRSAEFRKNNPEKVKISLSNKEYKKKYRKNHKEIITQHRKNNPEKYSAYKQNRRARELNVEGTFTAKEWKDLCKSYGNKCACCGKRRKLTIDHVIPISKGGTNYIENIQPLCGSCNSSKGTKSTDYRKKEK